MKFLVDAQLPPLLSDWINNTNKHTARHVISLKDGLISTDNAIWKTALQSAETIITKDFDFFDRVLVSENNPVVLHINLGNCTNKLLINYVSTNWDSIIEIFNNGCTLVSCSSHDINYW